MDRPSALQRHPPDRLDPVTAGTWGRRGPTPRRARRPLGGWSARWRELTRAVSWHRRLLAAALAAVAVLAALDVLRPPAAVGLPVVVAAQNLPAGTRLRASDLHLIAMTPGTVPAGSARSVAPLVGSLLAAPVRTGEPVTDVRLVGTAVLATYRSTLGADVGEVTLRLSDPGALAFVGAGSHLDVLAAPTTGSTAGGPAVTVATDVPVLAVPGASGSGGDPASGSAGGGFASTGGASSTGTTAGLVVLAVSPATARLLAQAVVTSQISVIIHP